MNEGIRLLLIEDNPDDRAVFRNKLAASKVNAVIVGEASVAGDALTAAEEMDPDIVVLSLEEPFARPLRILESLTVAGGAPVIAVSSDGNRESMRKAMRAGAKEYLMRPLNADELGRTIESVFAAQQRRKAMLSGGKTAAVRALGEVFTIVGAKGGIGKTTLSANLAVALSLQTKRRVGLLDLNLELGDVPIMLDLVPERTCMDVLRIVDRLEPELLHRFVTEHNSGVQVLAACSDVQSRDGINNHNIGKIVETMAKSFDYVVIDTAPRLHGAFPSVLERSSMILVVTTPDAPCLKNTKLMLETLKGQHSFQDKVKLVVNNPYRADGLPNTEVSKILDHPVFWKIPNDSAVAECIRMGQPCTQAKPRAKFSRNLVELARTLSGSPTSEKGLFGWR